MTMKIYRIKADFDLQSFFPFDPKLESSGDDLVRADIALGRGVRKLSTWRPLPLFVEKPERQKGNFAHLWGFEDFAIDSRACEILRPILEQTCELLPFLPYEGHQYYRVNILNTVDCLNQEKTKWRMRPNGKRSNGIEEFQFDLTRVGHHSLFKLPKRTGLLTTSGLETGGPEFKSLIEGAGLTGLKFEEVWSEGGPPIRVKS